MSASVFSTATRPTEAPGGWTVIMEVTIVHPSRDQMLKLQEVIKSKVEDLNAQLNPKRTG